MERFAEEVAATGRWFAQPRFDGITRLYGARQVVEQRGTIRDDYAIARDAAASFFPLLRERFAAGRSITTFGPYSPGQAMTMRRLGIEAIYLGGWATSAKGSVTEDPGPDLASYPLSQVPEEGALLVRALLTADKNQQYAHSRLTEAERARAEVYDFRPFIIADADTGHGGEAHVRNLIRRFVEAGVPGYHIEDQRAGTKKCGHQGGKVLVASDEQIKRLNAARFQLDVMGVEGIIVARTDAEAATLLDGNGDERDRQFILGATNTEIPALRLCSLALLRQLWRAGHEEAGGHLLYAIADDSYAAADAWLESAGVTALIATNGGTSPDAAITAATNKLHEAWEAEADLKTYAEAGDTRNWNAELARTPEGYYQVRGGVDYAIAKSLAAAPFADLLWMETKSADLHEARVFAEAIHAEYPDKMLAYNLSPSFSWDTTGMSEDEMSEFPNELGKLGFVFNFITYGGHQIDGLAAEEFAASLQQDGPLALARLQRKFRLLESPYRTPQTLVGGKRADAALSATSGRSATTAAMGKGSTQFQHLVQTEVPAELLEKWLAIWTDHHQLDNGLRVKLRPVHAGSDLLELQVLNGGTDAIANVVFAAFDDRSGHPLLSIRDQNTFEPSLRRKRLMTLIHLFLVHRYGSIAVHYVSPTEDNRRQAARMGSQGLFTRVRGELDELIVAEVDRARVEELVRPDGDGVQRLISRDDSTLAK